MWIKTLAVGVLASFLALSWARPATAATLLADRDVEKGWEKKARKEMKKGRKEFKAENRRGEKHRPDDRYGREDRRRPDHDGRYDNRRPGDDGRPDHRFDRPGDHRGAQGDHMGRPEGPRPDGRPDRPRPDGPRGERPERR